ncbi:MAG TPA: ATP-binding cassette domain-containing protein, partial [Burkholderiaceae bacterium]|nr:ATP-binding cassette domain-containing protein [Burkholderiaceae bacterium]
MPPLLSVRRVSRSFGGLQAVRSVSFELAAGEILGIIGPNGAGKSTLFDLIAGRTAPDDGDVVFEGRSIVRRPPEAVARAGLVKTFQTSRPFGSMSFAENVMVGALAAGVSLAQARMLAHEKLAVVGLGARADASAAWASTGQRKRLEIARALAAGPRPLLLDRYLSDATEVDVDCIADGKDTFIAGIMEHIEEAGVHSGDSACSLPPHSLDAGMIARLEEQTRALALALKVG